METKLGNIDEPFAFKSSTLKIDLHREHCVNMPAVVFANAK